MKRISKEDLEHISNHMNHLCDDLRNKSIFLTGGTGFFGKWMLESFVYLNEQHKLNASLTVLSRNPEKFLNDFPFYSTYKHVVFIQGDIVDFEYPNGKFDYIIHAATEADAKVNSELPILMLDTIVLGTKRVLEFARIQQVSSFLLTSSGAIYGKQPSTITHVKETDGFFIDINNSDSSYAEGKRLAELYCADYYKQYGVPVKIARCFAFVGPYLPLDKHFAIGNFIQNGLNQEDIVIKGDGTPYRSYLYAADLTIWLWTILLKGDPNIPYNVGSDEQLNIEDTAKTVAHSFNDAINYKIIGKPKGEPIHRYVPDISKAKKQLGLDVYISISDAIQRTIKFNN